MGNLESQISIWNHKPWWCQPWTILLTGCCAVVASWLLLQRWWITSLLALGVTGWWWLFLVLVPRSYREAMASTKNSDQT